VPPAYVEDGEVPWWIRIPGKELFEAPFLDREEPRPGVPGKATGVIVGGGFTVRVEGLG
jgi:hypothetical protein